MSSGGRPAWKVSFFDFPGGPAWFTIVVDKATRHTKELWMVAQVHFIRAGQEFAAGIQTTVEHHLGRGSGAATPGDGASRIEIE